MGLSVNLKHFLKDSIERAIKTAAQVAVASIGTSQLMGEVSWGTVASTTGLATILSLLTSIASYNFGDKGTASVVSNEEI